MPSYNALRRAYGLRAEDLVHRDHRRGHRPVPERSAGRPPTRSTIPTSSTSSRCATHRRRDRAREPGGRRQARHGRRRTTLAARLRAHLRGRRPVDAFVGMVAEPHVPGPSSASCSSPSGRSQFEALRDGDRFFYANDPALTQIERRTGSPTGTRSPRSSRPTPTSTSPTTSSRSPTPRSSSTSKGVGATVPATLSLTVGSAPGFGTFLPGLAKDYLSGTTATVISTAGDALLTVADPSPLATGHLVNGTIALPQARQAGGAPGRRLGEPDAAARVVGPGQQRGRPGRVQAARGRQRCSANRCVLQDADLYPLDHHPVAPGIRHRSGGSTRQVLPDPPPGILPACPCEPPPFASVRTSGTYSRRRRRRSALSAAQFVRDAASCGWAILSGRRGDRDAAVTLRGARRGVVTAGSPCRSPSSVNRAGSRR